jgi:hypothetical protein
MSATMSTKFSRWVPCDAGEVAGGRQFVIRVPDALPDGQAWSHAVTKRNFAPGDVKQIEAK